MEHPPAQRLGGGVDELELVSLAHDPFRDALTHVDAGDRLDGVGDALNVLDVHRAQNGDPRIEQLGYVRQAFLVAPGIRDVRVGELVDEGDFRMTGEHRFEVHLLEGRSAVLDAEARYDLERPDLLGGPPPAAVSTKPMTTSLPRSRRRWPSSSIAMVLPTPATAPR